MSCRYQETWVSDSWCVVWQSAVLPSGACLTVSWWVAPLTSCHSLSMTDCSFSWRHSGSNRTTTMWWDFCLPAGVSNRLVFEFLWQQNEVNSLVFPRSTSPAVWKPQQLLHLLMLTPKPVHSTMGETPTTLQLPSSSGAENYCILASWLKNSRVSYI